MTAEADLIRAIREAGRQPVQRNTFYEPLREPADPSRVPPVAGVAGVALA
jgi:2-iminoacetate synthase ThiH